MQVSLLVEKVSRKQLGQLWDNQEQAAIAARKAEIKASWTPNERAARCVGGRRKRCEIPHYRYDNNFAGFIGVSSLS